MSGDDFGAVAPATATAAARAVALTKVYGSGEVAVRALDGVDVEFEAGRFTAVMGPSGSGKSTLMHCLAGLDIPTSGQAFVAEQEIGTLDDAGLTQLRRERIGFVFQSFNLIPTLTAEENITLSADLAGRTVDRDWFDYLVGRLRIADRYEPPAQRALGWAAAAGRLRACAGRATGSDLRRRADRQPRLERLGGGARLHARRGRRAESVDRDGHARAGGCRLRGPCRVPRRWQSRRRAARPNR